MQDRDQKKLGELREDLSNLFQDAQAEVESLEERLLPLDDRVPAECTAFTFSFNMACGCAGVMGGLESSAAAADGSMDTRITERCQEHQDPAHDPTIYAAVMMAWGKSMGLPV